jgi:hypothetical protein
MIRIPLPSGVGHCSLYQAAADAMPPGWRRYINAVQFEQSVTDR